MSVKFEYATNVEPYEHVVKKEMANELLEALIKCADALDEVSYQSWCGEIIDEARAAIAKATGETK